MKSQLSISQISTVLLIRNLMPRRAGNSSFSQEHGCATIDRKLYASSKCSEKDVPEAQREPDNAYGENYPTSMHVLRLPGAPRRRSRELQATPSPKATDKLEPRCFRRKPSTSGSRTGASVKKAKAMPTNSAA